MLRTVMRILDSPYEAMKEVAESRRTPIAAWIIGGLSAPLLALFGVLAKTQGGLPAWPWYSVVWVPPLIAIVTYLGAALTVGPICRLVGGQGDPRRHLSAWALTYPPTIFAFAVLILGHLTFPGEALQNYGWLQLVFFATLLAAILWKLLLYFIYLRAVGGLGFKQTIGASAILYVVVILYELAILRLGLGQVPFI